MLKYTPPSKDLFIQNRKNLISKMKKNTAAVFFSNDLVNDNGDSHYPFTQNSNLYYLTGIDQEDVILFLFPEAPREEQREILFIKKTNAQIHIWEGWKYSIEEAREASGIQTIKYIENFNADLHHLISHIEGIYLDFNEHDRNVLHHQFKVNQFANELRNNFPAHPILRSNPLLESLRMKKSDAEVEQIKKAIDITHKTFLRVLKFVKPGIYEYEIEAEILHEFIRNKATGPAYQSIIASGENACVLHYISKSQKCNDGDLILFDFGAEYGNYSSDLSRSIPVNGKFTKRQKDVYNSVLHVMKEAKKLLKPSTYTLDEYHVMVGEIMQEELVKLGLISNDDIKNQDPTYPAYKKYFMHGTSHHMGLDTHDLGSRYVPFCSGMVFTCEPGIYIPEENLGIRLENDILITDNGPIDLMKDIPIEVDEIEEIMSQS